MKRYLALFLLLAALQLNAQVYTFECVSGARLTGDSCDICPNTIVDSRSFNGLVIYRDSQFYRWVDQPYSIRTKPGGIVEYWEHGANPYSERITIPFSLTGFFTVEGMSDSTWCNFQAPNRYQRLGLDSLAPTDFALTLVGDPTDVVLREGSNITFSIDGTGDTLVINSTGGGGATANNGVSDNEGGGVIRLGNRYMGTPDAPFTMARKINIDGRLLHIGDLSDSTLFVVDGANDRIGIRTDAPAKDLHVNGEARISDLTNGTPDRVVGANSSGDLSRLFLSGMSVISGVLTATDSSATNEIQTIDTFAIVSDVLRLSLSSDGQPFKSVDLSPYAGNGTVNSFSANDLAPLFTTTEATPTTTPVLSFTLTNAAANTYFGNATGVGAAPSYTAAGALTKTDDTNVTLTLGGNPNTSLLRAVSLTLGWTGTLSVSRGGIGVGTITGIMQGNGAGAVTGIANSATVGQVLRVTGTDTYAWGALDLADADARTGRLPFANIAQITARSVWGVTGNATADGASIQGTADQVLRVNTGGTALAFGTVATGGIADDAVTYAKIQNVVDDERILGRVSGANGNVEELTVAQVYTMLNITAQDTRVAIGKGANIIGHDAGLVWNYTDDRLTALADLPGNGAGAAIVNIQNVGTDVNGEFLQMRGNMSGNMIAGMYNLNNTAAANTIWVMSAGGAAAADAVIQFTVNGVITHAVGIDNTDDRLKLTPNAATPGATANMGVIIRDNGGVGNTGINKDFPGMPLDGLGIARFELWEGTGNSWTAANVAFGGGAGTGPTLTTVTGLGNAVRIDFTTGTTPTADGDVLLLTFPFGFTTTSMNTFSARDADAAVADFYISAENATSCTLKVKGTLSASTSYYVTFHLWGY